LTRHLLAGHTWVREMLKEDDRMTLDIDRDRSAVGYTPPRVVSIVGGAGFVALGVWGMVSPQSFFEAVAKFEPYNQHFLQDIGAFQIGLGVILLLAGLSGRADGLTIALIGVGVAAAFHTVSHVVGRDLGGFPEREIPAFAVMAAILLVAGGLRWRQVRAAAR
jgi:hypothetical protein